MTRLLLAIWVLNAVVILGFSLGQGGAAHLDEPGAVLLLTGRLTGLFGTYATLVQLVLVARIPAIDGAVGMDRLLKWHRTNGHGALYLMLGHAILITLGYAAADGSGLLHEAVDLTLNYRDVLMSVVALVLFVATVITSIRIARRRMRYETWYFVHLYTYLAIALALPHQLMLGQDFVGHFWTRAYWWFLFVVSVGAILIYRLGLPLFRGAWHSLRVANVVIESPTVVTVYFSGRNLARLEARAGQFFLWRFLTSKQWWQAHPYSLSAAPNGRFLRITVKHLGDASALLRDVKIGTRVLAEGPYGAFTAHQRTKQKVLLIAGGVGITPIRALLEELPARPGDITLLYRVSNRDDAVLLDEIEQIAAFKHARINVVHGAREEYSPTRQPLGAAHLSTVVPDVRERDVYICGPEAMTTTVIGTLRDLGVPRRQIHFESFAF